LREGWQRGEAALALDRDQVERLIRDAFPAARLRSFEPALGGMANTNIKVLLADPPHAVLLRLYQRDPVEAPKEAALNALVLRHGVPTARFLHAAPANEVTGGPYAIQEWVEGPRLETALPGMTEAELEVLAQDIGRVLARIHAIGFEEPGFLDAELRIGEPVDLGAGGLRAFLRQSFVEGIGGERLGGALTAELMSFVDREGDRLEAWLGRPCLTHSDFNGSNILVHRTGTVWVVAAVLDWEFAFSGTPAIDFGNLLRAPLGQRRSFVDALAPAYETAGGYLPPDRQAIARIADLYAWADFLARPAASPALIADARHMIRRTIGR
jgi:aminoglycoside phosphotransferase (APT) family kinase protein